ncbi:MAG: glycosyltransferase family 9 protein [Chitinophagaceae bacterium]|nr:glycosyltransferase family 9 protein [Chitinophagaceae bacterium]
MMDVAVSTKPTPAGAEVFPKPVKVLIIRFSSIGDIVLTTPVIRCVKKQLLFAEVHYLTRYAFKSLLESNPYIDKLHLLNDNMAELLPSLIKEQFDYVIDLHHNVRTLKVKRALDSSVAFSFKKLNVQKWLLTALKVNVMPKVHIVDRYMDTVKTLGIRNDGMGLDYFIPDQDRVPDNDLPMSHAFGFIGVVIGAALNTKKLPTEKLKELCSKIDYPIILLGGPEDKPSGDEIASGDSIRIYNSCGKFNLNESADLVRRSKFIITHDTGLMHIAAAFKKQIISIWGNTVPEFGMDPYYGLASQPSDEFEVKGLWCRPCSKIGFAKCPLGHFKCMNKQDIEKIVQTTIIRLAVK